MWVAISRCDAREWLLEHAIVDVEFSTVTGGPTRDNSANHRLMESGYYVTIW